MVTSSDLYISYRQQTFFVQIKQSDYIYTSVIDVSLV